MEDVAGLKKQRVKELLAQGMSRSGVQASLKSEFGSGVGCGWLNEAWHKHNGTTPITIKRKKSTAQKKKSKKSNTNQAIETTETRAIETQPLEVHVAPRSTQVDGLLQALLRAMRAEGVDSVMVRADGRATVYHVVSREIQVR